MKNTKYIINGRHLFGPVGGVQRYIRETLKALDNLVEPGEITVAIPSKVENNIKFNNIEIKKVGRLDGILWEQFEYSIYLILNRKKGVNLCTAVPLLYPKGIVTIHDVMPKRYKEVRSALKPWNYILLDINYHLATRFSDAIITDSTASKEDIVDLYHVPEEKVIINPLAWQHMEEIKTVEYKAPFINSGEFFLGLSSNRWQKNFRWIEEVAKRNPDSTFVIVGSEDTQQKSQKNSNCKNVHYTGYLSDGEIKWLYLNCKAFLFPSICEGFGIPPLEALACGARVLCSETSCMPEVMKNAAVYFNPRKFDIDINRLYEKTLQKKIVEGRKETLNSYSWEKTAKVLLSLMNKGV